MISVGVVLGPAAPLFPHHLPLRVDLLGIEKEAAHTIGLEARDEVPVVGRGRLTVLHKPRTEAAADDAPGQRGELAVVLADDSSANHGIARG